MKSKRFVLALLLVGVGLIALLLFSRNALSGRLSDGSVVVLEGVTSGREHHSPISKVTSLIGRLPDSVLRFLRWKSPVEKSFTFKEDIFAFWLKFENADGDKSIRYAIADENGFEAPALFTGPYVDYHPAAFGQVMNGKVRSIGLFPRRSKRFYLRLYEQDKTGRLIRVANFPVKNTMVSSAPAFITEPFPVSKSTNGISFTLLNVNVGVVPAEEPVPPYDSIPGQWTEFTFRVVDPDASAAWNVPEILMYDPMGKAFRQGSDSLTILNGTLSRKQGDEIVCFSRWRLWPSEPTVKMRAHFQNGAGGDCWAEYFFRPVFLK